MKVFLGQYNEGPIHLNIANMTDEESRTMYFALRAYRDSLHKTLQSVLYKSLDGDDYRTADWDEHIALDKPLNEFVPDVHVKTMLDCSEEYEEFMFLFEQLAQVNAFLFQIMQNHDQSQRVAIEKFFDV